MLYALLLLLTVSLYGAGLLAPPVADATPDCTHYSSNNGQSDGSSMTHPMTVQAFWPKARPGMVLCLLDGTYQGTPNMIQAPSTVAGTAEAPITIRALNEGQVLLDGQDSRRPVDLQGRYGVLEGVNVTRGDNTNVALRGEHWTVRRVVSWDVGAGGDSNFRPEGKYNVLEDCAAFGPARKQITAGSGGAGARYNTIRRCWTRWEANLHQTSNPSVSFEVGYGQDAVWAENVIATWDTQGRVTEPEGALELFATQDSVILGSIFYVAPGATYSPSRVIFATSDAGSHYQSGDYHPTARVQMAQLVTYLPPPLAAKTSATFSKASQGPAGGPNWVEGLVAIGGQPPTFTANWTPSGIRHGATVEGALGGTSLWETMPGLCRQVVNGQITDVPLWPWPMNARIIAAMQTAGVEPVDVTATLESLLGPLPAACKTGGPPPEPEPSPVVLEYALDGGQTWMVAAELAQVPHSLCLRLKSSTVTSTRLCLEKPPTGR